MGLWYPDTASQGQVGSWVEGIPHRGLSWMDRARAQLHLQAGHELCPPPSAQPGLPSSSGDPVALGMAHQGDLLLSSYTPAPQDLHMLFKGFSYDRSRSLVC